MEFDSQEIENLKSSLKSKLNKNMKKNWTSFRTTNPVVQAEIINKILADDVLLDELGSHDLTTLVVGFTTDLKQFKDSDPDKKVIESAIFSCIRAEAKKRKFFLNLDKDGGMNYVKEHNNEFLIRPSGNAGFFTLVYTLPDTNTPINVRIGINIEGKINVKLPISKQDDDNYQFRNFDFTPSEFLDQLTSVMGAEPFKKVPIKPPEKPPEKLPESHYTDW